MPPKKKDRPLSPVAVVDENVEPLTAMERELYIIQVNDLEGRVNRYQRRLDELEVTKTDSDEKHDQFSKDLQDVITYLKKGLNQKIDEVADLNDKIVGLVQAKETDKTTYESQMSQLRQEFHETKDRLTSENMILAGKLDALEEFRIQKEDLMANFAALEQQLLQQEEEHTDIIYNLERRAVIDKDRFELVLFGYSCSPKPHVKQPKCNFLVLISLGLETMVAVVQGDGRFLESGEATHSRLFVLGDEQMDELQVFYRHLQHRCHIIPSPLKLGQQITKLIAANFNPFPGQRILN
ncbi:cilia- and flagella-associated protein 157-like [Rhinoraja longicauda]